MSSRMQTSMELTDWIFFRDYKLTYINSLKYTRPHPLHLLSDINICNRHAAKNAIVTHRISTVAYKKPIFSLYRSTFSY